MPAEQLTLPVSVVTVADVGRLMREAEAVDGFLNQAAVRQPGTAVQLPKTSHLLEEIVSGNNLNMLQQTDRKTLLDFLKSIRMKAPVLHVSFNTDPSPVFLQRLITWIRQQMHPHILLQVGLHPNIGAGCVVRTTNKFFDFSLRHKFTQQRKLLIDKLRGEVEMPADPLPTTPVAAPPIVNETPTPQPQVVTATPPQAPPTPAAVTTVEPAPAATADGGTTS